MMKPFTEFMTASAWYAYTKVHEQSGQFEFAKPLPGYRIDHAYPDGTIADYKNDGTRQAYCYNPDRKRIKPLRDNPAMKHCHGCSCGYRVVRSPWVLLEYLYGLQRLTQEGKFPTYANRQALGHGTQGKGRREASIVVSRVYAYGTAEPSDHEDPEFTIRAANTQLLEVFLPTEHEGNPVSADTAQKIRDRYKVPVHQVKGEIYNYPYTPHLDPPMPDDWSRHRQQMMHNLEGVRNGTLDLTDEFYAKTPQ